MRFKKINLIKWCDECDQGWIHIVKSKVNNKLYCQCSEWGTLFATPADVETDNYMSNTERIFEKGKDGCDIPFLEEATEAEIIKAGWPIVYNKVTTCHICFNTKYITADNFVRRRNGWILIKKDKANGDLFCQCDNCKSTWATPEDVLRQKDPIKLNYTEADDATKEDIKIRGWDKYDDVFYIGHDINTLFYQLKDKGIQFKNGLTDDEINKIEEIYRIVFPKWLRKFYILGVPFSEENDLFPLWSDFSETNIAQIKARIQKPYKMLSREVQDGFWLTSWGSRPESKEEALQKFGELSSAAPRLIPIYSHRYMPLIDGVDDPPVISISGSDVIYYGCNLHDYLQNEFLNEEFAIPTDCIKVPFWDDLVI